MEIYTEIFLSETHKKVECWKFPCEFSNHTLRLYNYLIIIAGLQYRVLSR